jgi:hypothetical protein
MDVVWHGSDEGVQDVSGDTACGLLMQFDEGEFGHAVDGNQQIEPTLGGLDFGDVDVEVTERVGLEFAFARSGALDFGQPGDAMTLQAAVQRGPCQVRDGGLEGIQSVVQWQQGMSTECNHDGLFLEGQPGGMGLLGSGRQVLDGAADAPFGDDFGIDAVTLGQIPQAFLTMLYRSTDCRCRWAPPWKTWPIALPSTHARRLHHQTLGSHLMIARISVDFRAPFAPRTANALPVATCKLLLCRTGAAL